MFPLFLFLNTIKIVGYMLRLSKKVEYALIALIDLAKTNEQQPTTAKYLAEHYQMPQELLGKVMQTLTKNGLLQSVQGVKGGYILGKKPEQIKLSQIIEILEGPISITSCGLNHEDLCGCDIISTCTIRSPLEIIQLELSKYFESISLKDLRTNYYNGVSAPIQLTV